MTPATTVDHPGEADEAPAEPVEPAPVPVDGAPREESQVPIAPLELSDIDERRRDSLAGRLRALRERPPAKPAPVADPAAAEREEPAPAEPEGPRAPDPNAGRGASLRDRLSALGAAAGGGGRRIADAWDGVPAIARRRIAAVLIVAAVAAIVLFVVVPAAPCGAPGGDSCPPEDDAVELVPDDALAYAHADIDPESDQYGEASEFGERLPLLSRLAVSSLSAELARTDFEAEVRPWAGGEVAIAIMPGARRLDRVLLVEAADQEKARAFADDVLGPRPSTSDVGGTEVSTGSRGLAAAIVDGFLALGDEDAVRELVDPEGGTLADSDEVDEVLDELPDERLAYAYLSGEGARALFADPALSQFAAFVDPGASSGVGVALSVSDDVLALEARSVLDPERAEASPGFFSALPPFEPELPADVGSEALAYLGLGDPGTSVEALLDLAAADAPDLLRAANRFERDLGRDAGVRVRDEILPLLGSEAALSVQPRKAEVETVTPGTLEPSGVPYVSLIADGVNAERASAALADLQAPVAEALAASGRARVPGFETARIAGVDAQSLLVDPDVNLTYAVFDDRLVIATSPIGIEQARAESAGLDSAPAYERVSDDLPERVSAIAYLDLRGLVALGEEIGLATDPGYAGFADDARALEAAIVSVSREDGAIRTDARLSVGEPQLPPPPVGETAPPDGG